MANMQSIVTGETWKHIDGPIRQPMKRYGEHHPMNRITSQEVETIRFLARTGMTQYAIAQRYGLSRGYISDIVRRKRWKHIP